MLLQHFKLIVIFKEMEGWECTATTREDYSSVNRDFDHILIFQAAH